MRLERVTLAELRHGDYVVRIGAGVGADARSVSSTFVRLRDVPRRHRVTGPRGSTYVATEKQRAGMAVLVTVDGEHVVLRSTYVTVQR
jgi:hypothetical protein